MKEVGITNITCRTVNPSTINILNQTTKIKDVRIIGATVINIQNHITTFVGIPRDRWMMLVGNISEKGLQGELNRLTRFKNYFKTFNTKIRV